MEKYTKSITIEKEMFVATDGQEFESEWECEDYENSLVQAEKEKLTKSISYDANRFDWASMANPHSKHEYKWYKIKNDEELKVFCDYYQSYCRNLKDLNIVKKYISYPDYICLVDYPKGPEQPEWFTLSKLLEQTNMFMSQFSFNEKGNLC